MRYFVFIALIMFISCLRNDDKSSHGQVSSGSIATKRIATEFSRQINSQIPENLQLDQAEINAMVTEGLISADEASLLKENL